MEKLKLTSIFALLHFIVSGKTAKPKLEFGHLTGDFYIYTTYNTYCNSKVPADCLYLVTEKGVACLILHGTPPSFNPCLTI